MSRPPAPLPFLPLARVHVETRLTVAFVCRCVLCAGAVLRDPAGYEMCLVSVETFDPAVREATNYVGPDWSVRNETLARVQGLRALDEARQRMFENMKAAGATGDEDDEDEDDDDEEEGAAEGAAGGDGDAVGQLVAMAAFVPGDGWVDPTLLAQGYLHGARRHSQTVELRSNTTAESVISDRGNRRVRGVGLADGAIIECDSVVDATGMWAGMLQVRCVDGVTHRAGGRSLPMASTRSHYFITQHEPESFPSTMPNVIVPDARFYTRPEAAGAMLIGIQEKDSMSGDARRLGAFADDAAGAGGGVDGGVGARVDSVAAHDAAGASSAQAEELLLEMSGDIERFLADGVLDRYEYHAPLECQRAVHGSVMALTNPHRTHDPSTTARVCWAGWKFRTTSPVGLLIRLTGSTISAT